MIWGFTYTRWNRPVVVLQGYVRRDALESMSDPVTPSAKSSVIPISEILLLRVSC